MQAFFKLFFEQVRDLLKRLDVAQKITLSLLSFIIVVGLVTIAIWGASPDYEVLFSGLTAQDAGEVVKKLDERGIKYKIGPKGDSVSVPSKYVRELRVSLATEGLPKGSGLGFELFDTFKLGATDFTQKVNYQRALEAELARTIMQLSQVRFARVHLVMPGDALFVEDKEEATASLVLDLVGVRSLTEQQIGGLVHLVSKSVKGLSAGNVTIVDSYGNLLFAESEDDHMRAAGMSQKQHDVERRYERVIESRLQSMLTRIFGQNNSVVRVNVVLDFDENVVDSEIFEPSETELLRSQQTVEEGFQGENASPPSDLFSSNLDSDGGAKSNFSKLNETKNFEITKHIKHTVQASGKIKSLSIAVVIDREIAGDQLASITSALSAASGINPERGDTLVVKNIPFDKSLLENDQKEMKRAVLMSQVTSVVKNVGLVVLALGTLLFIRRTLRNINGGGRARPFTPARADFQAGAKAAVPSVELDNEPLDPVEQKRMAMQQGLVDMIDGDARVFTQILRRWLNEEI
jgi:flagellar M-ring protein FliF